MSSSAPAAARDPSLDPTARLHPQLIADCHVIGRLERATILLHHNALVGWLILVPDTDALDWQELDDAEHERIAHQVRELANFASGWFSADKMNIASIGNEVAELHLHVVARKIGDACWPRPVWGHLPDNGVVYSKEGVRALVEALADSPLGMSRPATAP